MNIAAFGIGSNAEKTAIASFYEPGHEGSVAAKGHGSGLSLHVLRSVADAAARWQEFERDAAGSLYQSFLWARAWCDTVGAACGIQQRIVMATDRTGAVQFVLPLQIRRRQGVRVLEWLGSPHHGYGYGVFHRNFLPSGQDWFAAHWPRLVEAAGPFDAVALTEMPGKLLGHPHPMTPLFNSAGANPSFILRLQPDFDQLHARKRGGEDRRGARKREKALSRLGELSFGLPGSADVHTTLDVMFRQQEKRLAELGIHGVFGPLERQFIHRLAELQDAARPVLVPFRLAQNGETLAVMLGGLHNNTYWALISSLAAGPVRKYSPGDAALRLTIRACCEAGLSSFDFSAGDSPYKRAWADEVVHLHNHLAARNLKGLTWAMATALQLAVKRLVKTSPPLFAAVAAVRRLALGRSRISR